MGLVYQANKLLFVRKMSLILNCKTLAGASPALVALTCERAVGQQVLQSADSILSPHPEMRSQVLQKHHLRALQDRGDTVRYTVHRHVSTVWNVWRVSAHLDVLDKFLEQVA